MKAFHLIIIGFFLAISPAYAGMPRAAASASAKVDLLTEPPAPSSKRAPAKAAPVKRAPAKVEPAQAAVLAPTKPSPIPREVQAKLQKMNYESSYIIVIKISDQTLSLYENQRLLESYTISSAAKGVGQRESSFQTPLGLHRIANKIGKTAAPYTIFSGGRDTGKRWNPDAGKKTRQDLVLSRILVLEGLEDGLNRGEDGQGWLVDSKLRHIYIHATPEEEKLGTPASHGCIRMSTPDVTRLFEKTPLGAPVWIMQ